MLVRQSRAGLQADTHVSELAMVWRMRRLLNAGLVLSGLLGLCICLANILPWRTMAIVNVALILSFIAATEYYLQVLVNASIGFLGLCLSWVRGADRSASATFAQPLDWQTRTAIVMTVRNEPPDSFIARLSAVKESLDAAGAGDHFDYYILSDTSGAEKVKDEELRIAQWTAIAEGRVVYRRREHNVGFKPGNVREFCARWGSQYEFMLLLDADSLMTGDSILTLIGIMQSNPRIGILQSLIVGCLPPSFFARVFEFGHRHALRVALPGAAWWQADRCSFWGHNAAIRLAPFMAWCEMPFLSGKGPFSGHVTCHDQIEACFMHRAGFEVRVWAHEGGSFEGVPPTVTDFLKRNHRWCQGNLKNLRVMASPGLGMVDRYHLFTAAHRFLTWPAFVVTILLCLVETLFWSPAEPVPTRSIALLCGLWVLTFLGPRLLGLTEAMLFRSRSYGGLFDLFLGGLVEILFTMLVTPIMMAASSFFMVGLAIGRTVGWEIQQREGHQMSWLAAFTLLWPETLLGLMMTLTLALLAPHALIWFLPFLLGLLLAVPFAVVTSSSVLARSADTAGLCRLPEEIHEPKEIRDVREGRVSV